MARIDLEQAAELARFAEKLEAMLYERGYRQICGVDEVGRGPLAGPVVAAAVILAPDIEIDDIQDSKKLSPARREAVFAQLVAHNVPCAIGIIDHTTIDQINILQASLRAMRKAVMDLKQAPEVVLVDGTFGIPRLTQPQFTIIGGDRCCRSVAAASIVAKVTRDRIMDKYQALYPSFNFSGHKGYPTKAHLAELKEHGPCDIHRKSFKPVAKLLKEYALI